MNINPKSTLLLMLIAYGLCGCSPQRKLARAVAEADRVVVTNAYDRFSISITGSEAKKVVRAVSSARKLPPEATTSAEVRIEFYHGTNLLGVVLGCKSMFGNRDGSYLDDSGVFNALYEKYEEQHLISTMHGR